MKDKFYCIQALQNGAVMGWVIQREEHVEISAKAVADITQWKTFDRAEHFLRFVKRKSPETFSKYEFKILSNSEMMVNSSTGISMLKEPMWYLENSVGEKLFYESRKNGYIFEDRDTGFCGWKTEEEIWNFVRAYELEKTHGKMFPKELKPKTEANG